MKSSLFTTLPEELLDRIICMADSRATLHALCLVSKDVNRLATARLYAKIALTKDDFRHLRPLAVLLWTSENHRHAVRSFSVRHAYGGNLDPWPKHSGLDDMIREQIREYVRERDTEQWFAQVRDGIDALPIASLLLRSLPYVSSMQFDGFMLVTLHHEGGVDERDHPRRNNVNSIWNFKLLSWCYTRVA